MRELRDSSKRRAPPASTGGTARARMLLILGILKGETSIAEVARRNEVPVATVERWKKQFLTGAENALRPSQRLQNALRESEERYRTLFDAGNDPIFVYGLDADGVPGRFVEVNEVACRTLGYTRQELLQLGPVEIRAPEERASFPSVAAELLRSQRLVFESSFVTKGGEPIPVEVNARLFTLGGRRGILAIARDITERQRTEEAYRSAIEVADAARRVKSEFLSNVSHELRTPLNTILGYADLLLDGLEGPVAPGQSSSLEKIRAGGVRLLEIVDEMLDLSVAQAEQTEPDPVVFALRRLLQEAAAAHQTRARNKGIELVWECDAGVPDELIGDARRLGQVLDQLLDNGVKFTKRGRITLRAELAGRDRDQVELHLVVQDTGEGIPPQHVETVFRPFVQLDGSTTRHHGGIGLGLAIVRNAVETLGGRVWVESTPGSGSTFHVTVHLRCADETGPVPP